MGEQVGDFVSAAYHEAGHAVMATVLGRRIDTVRIEDKTKAFSAVIRFMVFLCWSRVYRGA